MDRDDIAAFAFFAGIPVVGAATTIALEKAVTKYGHVFQHHFQAEFGVKNMALLGVIGAIQNIASLFLGFVLLNDNDSRALSATKMVIAHIITAGTLVGLTTLAAKTNLIASRLTVFAGIALVTGSLITNLFSVLIMMKISD